MPFSFFRAARSSSALLATYLLVACGGTFRADHDDQGSGGQAGGSGSAGSAGSESGSCTVKGKTYADGEPFPSPDGCNTCSCNDGEMACTQLGCAQQCFYEGSYYQPGDGFPALDGCNSCTCGSGGFVTCTTVACEACSEISAAYAAAMEETRRCDPAQTGQCSQLIGEGLQCGCETHVNPANAAAIAEAQSLQQQYSKNSCGGGVLCGACQPPTNGYCSPEGRCEDVWSEPASCKVNGVVYPSGSGDIRDPVSCNSCGCEDGALLCTEIGCPTECPPNSAYGTQCAQCGPADDCEVVEHACLPVCAETCEAGATCVLGVCKLTCG